jgi:ATP-dependent DNA helicase RecG
MAIKPKIVPRKMMEKAVEVMHQSISEPRMDKKASPLVGAVLYKPNGSVETAFRGELRHGDHAEYTLLERKHRNKRLDGSVLFATLEPCAPGARKHPKLSCAERIVLARIKEVWVGIEDPDPTVDRQGIKYLQDCGVKVQLFDRDLQDKIRRANKTFIEQARGRAAEARQTKTVKLSVLSKLEDAQVGVTLNDLSKKALDHYRKKAKMVESSGSAKFNRRLLLQGFLRQPGRHLVPTGFGLLLFGRNPRDVIQQAGLKGTLEYPDGEHEIQDFDGPLILIPDAVERWLRNKLPNVIDRSRMVRQEKAPVPFDPVRESIINALVHRDYDMAGATCHLVVTPDTITIKSPGAPPQPVTLKQLQAFNAPMLNRNPKLQFVFGGTKLVEGRGLGMRTLGAMTQKYHLPLPKYSFDGIYLTVTIYRNARASLRALDAAIERKLNKPEKSGWQWLSTRSMVTSIEYASAMNLPNRTALNHLKQFTSLGLLHRKGSGPATQYEIRKP